MYTQINGYDTGKMQPVKLVNPPLGSSGEGVLRERNGVFVNPDGSIEPSYLVELHDSPGKLQAVRSEDFVFIDFDPKNVEAAWNRLRKQLNSLSNMELMSLWADSRVGTEDDFYDYGITMRDWIDAVNLEILSRKPYLVGFDH